MRTFTRCWKKSPRDIATVRLATWFHFVGGVDGGACVLCAGPVSYTHLDVYKRQDLKRDTKATLAGAAQGVPLLVERIVADLRHDGLTRPTQATGTNAAVAPK